MGTKGDKYQSRVLTEILLNGFMDENPRPHYEDFYPGRLQDDGTILTEQGEQIKLNPDQYTRTTEEGVIVCTPAHTRSINHVIQQYDLSKGECPILTLRPVAWKSAVKEILWIYQMQSNRLSDLHDMGIRYWDEWDIGDGTIGCRYGETLRKRDLVNKCLSGIKENPFGRRHIMSMWQEDDFSDETGGTTRGLNPCCYETIWNVRRGKDGELYLDMLLNQRSSDYIVSNSINELQYVALQLMFARHCGMKPGMFTHVSENVQIYDRHRKQAMEILNRGPVECDARLVLKEGKTDFYSFTIDDFEMQDYPLDIIKEKNPQLAFQMAI